MHRLFVRQSINVIRACHRDGYRALDVWGYKASGVPIVLEHGKRKMILFTFKVGKLRYIAVDISYPFNI